MAVTSAWIPGLCTVAAAGAVTVAAAEAEDAELADGPNRFARVAVLEVEDDAVLAFRDCKMLLNGLVVFVVPVTAVAGLPGLCTGFEETGCWTTGVLMGSIVSAECITILIRGFFGISQAARNPLKTELRKLSGALIFRHSGNFPPPRRNQIGFRE